MGHRRRLQARDLACLLIVLVTGLFASVSAAQAAPENDDFANAESLSSTPPADEYGNNQSATKEAGEPNHAGNVGGRSVWYSWTPASSGPVRISTCTFGNLDTLLAVYTGSAVNNLTPVASNDDSGGCSFTDSKVEFTASAGTAYWIAIDGRGGDEGFFELSLDGRPQNDDFENAKAIEGSLPRTEFSSNLLATKQAGEPNHAGDAGGHSVWFSWTAAASGPVNIATCAYGTNSLLAVYTGSAVGGLTQIAANDDSPPASCSAGSSAVTLTVSAGTTYRIAVDGKNGGEGSFELRLKGPPANDDFSNAQTFSPSLPEFASGSTVLATKQAGEPSHAGNAGGHSVWYSWTAASSGKVSVSTCNFGGIDSLLAVYTGSAVNNLSLIASNDDTPGCDNGGSEIILNAVSGTTYRIAVDGKGGAEGSVPLQLSGPPSNDSFASPTFIGSSLPDSAFGNNKVATKEAGEPNHAGDAGGHSVWYSWTPASSGPVEISTCSNFNTLDTLLAVYTGSAVNNLTLIASNDDAGGCRSTDSDLEFSAVAGTTYRIAVDGKNGSEGSINLQFLGRPANDDFSNAQALDPVPPASVSGTNKVAGKQAGEPNHAGNAGGRSVWYSWTPASSGQVSVSTCTFGSLDTLLAVYTGSAVNNLTPVASNDDGSAFSCGLGSEVQFDAVAGTTYRIAVDGKNGARGQFEVRLTPPPENDDFAAAQTLDPLLPESAFGTTKLATKQAGEPEHAGDPGGHSVWYSWTPAVSEPVSISTCESSFSGLDTLLAVYTGSTVNGLTPVASNDEGPAAECSDADSEVRFNAVSGTTYRIAVDGAGESSGGFNISLVARPENDDFASAPDLVSSFTTSTSGTNKLATKQAGEPNHAGNAGGHSVWFSWTSASSGSLNLSTCSSSGLDTLLGVYTGASVNALTPVASNDDSPVGGNEGFECAESGGSEVQFDAVAGTTYRIAVDGKGGSEGGFALRFQGVPTNDDFSNASTLSSTVPTFAPSSNKLATKQAGEPNHAGNTGGHSVWFSWTAAVSGPVNISTCTFGSNLDTLLAVYTGSAVNNLTPVASNDNSSDGCGSTSSDVELSAVAGTTYRIAVDGKGGSEGIFELRVRGTPANDDFAKAQTVGGSFPAFAYGTNKAATKQAGEPNHAGNAGGHSVWFSWTPSSGGSVELSSCTFSGLDTLLAVYTGSTVNGLTPIASNDDGGGCSATDSKVEFTVSAGTTYRIAVDGKNGSQGSFELDLNTRPVNDDFDGATAFGPGFSAGAYISNQRATKQAGEPNHAGNAGGHSVWYSWTPASSGPVDISTCAYGASLDTLLAVYTGSAVNGLTPVASNDDGGDEACESSTDSELQFDAVAGTTYRIAVDGKNGSTGTVELALSGRPANDDLAHAQPLGGRMSAQGFSSTKLASKQGGEPSHAGNTGGHSVWFKWTAPASVEVSVETCDSNLDTLLAVYTGSAVGSLTPVQGNDDGGGGCGTASKLTFPAIAGTTYRIAVDGKNGAQGSVDLDLAGAPANDDFSSARTVAGLLPRYLSGGTRLATKQAGEPNHAGNAGGHSVWFSWTPQDSGEVTIGTCYPNFDTLLAVYTGSAVNNLTPVASNDDGPDADECGENGENGGSEVSFIASAGTTYRIAVDGVSGDDGHFTLSLEGAEASLPQQTLSVAKSGSGGGTVSSAPTGIACAPTCSAAFAEGTVVTLSASPDSSSVFAGWSGACAGTGACEVTMSQARSVTATFNVKPTEGGGGGSPGGGAPGGGAAPAAVSPTADPGPKVPAKPKPLKCKPGFKKTKVHGKAKCVKKKVKHRK